MSNPAPRPREQPLAFASFRLFRGQKILLENQLPVRIGSRALELLIALVERAGEVVGKNELMACVWPETVVEENNLRVHISAIRKLLGDGDGGARFIINVAGRGYSFVAPVTRVDEALPTALPEVAQAATLPVALTRVVGRDAVVAAVACALASHRLVTLIGPGGIGKTTVGLAVADQLVAQGSSKVCFVDLAVVAEPHLVVAAVAAVVGTPVSREDPLAALASYLQPLQLLLILDNCEHLVAAVAPMVEHLLHVAPRLTILATSRELLQAEGEYAVPLNPLRCPDEVALTAAQAREYPAIELFAERALAAHDAFAVTDQNAATIAAICRRLDGVPLAIELVAARTGTLGLDVLLHSLDQGLMAVSGGRRRAAGRQQSLAATLDWSFRLLPEVEQVILLRLSAFRDLFPATAAVAVAAGRGVSASDVAAGLMSLVQRSLLVADTSGAQVRYRLLYVTRAFLATRLAGSDEFTTVQRRHAEHHCAVLEEAAQGWNTMPRAAWRATLRAETADLRAALDWAFGADGDAALGARLFLASLPIGVELSSRDLESRAMRTLQVLHQQSPRDLVAELRVSVEMCALLMQSGAREENLRQELQRMAGLAQQVGVPAFMTEAMVGHAVLALEAADYVSAVQRFEPLEASAKQADDAFAVLIADRLGAQVFHWAGDQKKARARAERVLRHPAAFIPLAYGQGPVDRQVSMRIVLARIAWLEGRADEAREVAATAAGLAASEAPIDVCQALAFASCPIALWRGDADEARALVHQLLDQSRRHGFMRWYRLALCYSQCLDPTDGERALPVSPLQRDLLATIDMQWADAGTLSRAESGTAGWCSAELLRVAGEHHARASRADAAAMAEMRFRTAMEYARGQGTLAWELRVATSLAGLLGAQGHRAQAAETLESACSRFSEGLHTADYRRALDLLGSL